MTLTEIFIHTLEALIISLVLIKLIQVRSLYLRSRPTKDIFSDKTPTNRKPKLNQESFSQTSNKNQFCRKNLPLPEVSFSHAQQIELKAIEGNQDIVEDVIENVLHTIERKPVTKEAEKCVLENYINDFFYEEKAQLFSESKPETEKEEDEFITIQKENAKIVRELQVTTNTRLAS